MKHLLKMSDLTPGEVTHILDVADQLKAQQRSRGHPSPAGGKKRGADVLQELHPHPQQL